MRQPVHAQLNFPSVPTGRLVQAGSDHITATPNTPAAGTAEALGSLGAMCGRSTSYRGVGISHIEGHVPGSDGNAHLWSVRTAHCQDRDNIIEGLPLSQRARGLRHKM